MVKSFNTAKWERAPAGGKSGGQVVSSLKLSDSEDTPAMLADGKRLRDISDLPLDLCIQSPISNSGGLFP